MAFPVLFCSRESWLHVVTDYSRDTESGTAMPLGKPLLKALNRMGYGGLVLDPAGQVLQINNTGTRLLREYGGRAAHDNDPNWTRHALKALLLSKGAARFR